MQYPDRYHGLDALRAGAMLMGLVLHAALVYVEPAITADLLPGTEPQDPSFPVHALVLWIHLWRMPLFFVLAGFFAQMVLERRGALGFVQDRAFRILGTCVIFTLLYNAISGQALGTLDHLWFIWVLWWLCALAGLLHDRLTAHIRGAGWLFATPRRMFWLWPVLIGMSFLLREETVAQIFPTTMLDPAPQGYLFCALCFVAGQALWTQRARMGDLARAPVYLGLIAAGLIGTALILGVEATLGDDPNQPIPLLLAIYLAAGTAAAMATGGMIFGLIGATQALVTRSGKFLAWLVRLSYPVYVFHLYIAIAISVALVQRFDTIPQLVNVGATTVITFGACTALYFLLVRFTPLEWLFAGWKNAWFKWPWAPRDRRIA